MNTREIVEGMVDYVMTHALTVEQAKAFRVVMETMRDDIEKEVQAWIREGRGN